MNRFKLINKTNFVAFCCLISIFYVSFKTEFGNKPTQLNWDIHFKGIPNTTSPYYAETSTYFKYKYNAKIRNGIFSIEFKFSGGVDSLQSWVKKDKIEDPKKSAQLLNHEQGHANIGYLLLKEAEIKISNQTYTESNFKSLIERTGNDARTYYAAMQKRYDDETQHGMDLSAQKKWDEYIANQLSKFK